MAKGRQTVQLPQSRRKPDGKSGPDTTKEPSDQEATKDHTLTPANIRKVIGLTLPLLTIAAFASPVSQATLAPVYGSIPSSVNHAEAIMATMLLGYLWRVFLQDTHSWSIVPYLALWCFWLPAIQIYLFPYSGQLGPIVGPILVGFLSCHTIIIPSAYAAAQAIEAFDLQGQLGNVAGMAIPAVALDLLYFRPVENVFASKILPWLMTYSSLFTPVKIQLLIGLAYTFLSPSKPYWLFSLTAPAVLHAILANPHFDSVWGMDVLNRDLAAHDWTLLDRAWSNTGYISVLESQDLHYRVLRCDHSLLGGEWLLTDERRKTEGWRVNEPIYSVFEMLEAVRLIEVEPTVHDSEAQALVVGLGIGTAPKALMAHGVDTTVVELDPVVHKYATEYFGLPNNTGTTVMQDAVSWVESESKSNTSKYHYIIHDVFTGGAEPLPLFSDVFLGNLRSLSTPNGVIALNYAGDLKLPLTARILNTIGQAFDGQCKIYRDAPPPDSPEKAGLEEDFLNMVVFCRNSPGAITFRKPTEADFLGSKSRKHYLLPRPDYEIDFPLRQNSTEQQQDQILRKGEVSSWRKQQEESAIRHWHIMRRVLPAAVWEQW